MKKPAILKTKIQVIDLLLKHGVECYRNPSETFYRDRIIRFRNLTYRVFLQYYVRRPEIVDVARIESTEWVHRAGADTLQALHRATLNSSPLRKAELLQLLAELKQYQTP